MIIVFGGTGMLGQHTAKELLDKGETVVVTGVRRQVPVLLQGAIERKQAFVEYIDLTDPYAVMGVVAKYKPNTVVDTSGYAPKQLAPAADSGGDRRLRPDLRQGHRLRPRCGSRTSPTSSSRPVPDGAFPLRVMQ